MGEYKIIDKISIIDIIIIETHFTNTLFSWMIVCYIFIFCSVYFILKQNHPVQVIFWAVVVINLIALLLRLWGAEFIALIILIIYTGVISVIFLSIIIIYYPAQNIPIKKLDSKIFSKLTAGFIIFFILLNCCAVIWLPCLIVLAVHNPEHYFYIVDSEYIVALFNDYWIALLVCGIIIFFTIIGSIAITFRNSEV